MGSGHFAEEGYKKASYFKNIEIVDEGEFMKPPVGAYPFMSEQKCYNIKLGTDAHWGLTFSLVVLVEILSANDSAKSIFTISSYDTYGLLQIN
ncbi:hypothetical protein Bca52824_049788 [Brassica carinata]|uniref:Neprosin PEP catalytic domain-containing protein n=1 Tax=Brassica carinata TaxID=52824 RepID=A0A8X7RR48_BRACI|nr:hypothetical protein Bca52824_049788 [Brassica carinata]